MSDATKIDEMQKALMRLPRPPAAIGDGPDERVGYVLDLVKRLGEEIKKAPDPAKGTCLSEYCDWYKEARALLKELEQ